MKKLFMAFPAILIVFLCFSCSQERFLLISHESFKQMLGPDTNYYREAGAAAANAGMAFELKMINDLQDSLVMETIAGSKAQVILLDPLVSLSRTNYSNSLPKTFFIAYIPAPTGQPPANVLHIEFDRKEAYEQAGQIAAMLLDLPLIRKDLNEKPKLGLITFSPDEGSRAEIDSFIAGFAKKGDLQDLVQKELPNLFDQSNAQNSFKALRDAKARLFFLRAYTLDSFLFDLLDQYKDFGIIGSPLDTPPFPGSVLFWIWDDYNASFRSSLAVSRKKEGENAQWEAGKLVLKSKLRWNPLIPEHERLKNEFPFD
jgi:hypothetical protein